MKEKRLFYFGLRNLLPIQIQLLDTENPKNPKIDLPLVYRQKILFVRANKGISFSCNKNLLCDIRNKVVKM
jgi:uncharacterized pyridoxamine 5'-phosphate oxidase family protein